MPISKNKNAKVRRAKSVRDKTFWLKYSWVRGFDLLQTTTLIGKMVGLEVTREEIEKYNKEENKKMEIFFENERIYQSWKEGGSSNASS